MLWKRPFQKHCTDELALAYLDGELSSPLEAAVRKHLNTCWECRGRLADLEEEAQSVARLLAENTFPGMDQKREAEQRFTDWEEQFERSSGTTRLLFLLPASSFRWWPTVSAAAILVAIAGFGTVQSFTRQRAVDVLMAGKQVESEFYRSPIPVHQSLRVEISEIRPQRQRSGGRIEIWSEPAGGRFSSHWRDDDGKLRFALWRPEKNREYVLNPKTAPGVAVLVSGLSQESGSLAQLSADGVDPNRIAAAFMRWLQSRRWRPISLTHDMSLLLDETGVTLRSERVRAEDGKPAIRLSAQRAQAGLRLEMILEVDAESYRPRLERIRFEADGRAVELLLTLDRQESVPLQRVVPAVFQPDVVHALVPALVPTRATVSRVIVPLRAVPPPAAEPAAERVALEAANIEVRYVLHRAGACLGEPIEITEDTAGYLHVSGLARTAGRKAELLDLLAQLESAPRFKVDIRTVEEAAIGDLPPSKPLPPETHNSASPLPIQTHLERLVANRELSAGARRQRIAELSNDAVSSSDAALAHAWALRRLAARYEYIPAATLRLQSRWLLEVMLRDHLTALRAAFSRLRELLDPLLTLANGELPAPPVREDFETANWRAAGFTVFNNVRRMDMLVQALFAGANLEGQQVELSAGELQGVLSGLDRNVRVLDVQVAKEFRLESSSARRPD
jgi:hypothetical protein